MEFIDLSVQQDAIRPRLESRLAAVLQHGRYIMGPEVAELEQILAAYVGVRHCVTVSSGTEALLISLLALGIGPGDEVITTPFTFIATAEVVALLGATPVFVDVEADTGLLDADLLEAAIGPRTRAIIPVSLYGQVPDLTRINEIAGRHGGIPVIEDAAQSFGATLEGRRSCGVSTVGCTSFFPSKPLGCYGDGGALFTDDDALAAAARSIRVHGQRERYVHERIGVGGRMDTLQCAVVLAKWPRFAWEVERRGDIGRRYARRFAAHGVDQLAADDGPSSGAGPALSLLAVRPSRTSVHAQYTIVVRDREAVRAHLSEAGIPTAVHYPLPINEQPAYRATAGGGPTPVSAWLARHVLSVPMGPDLSMSDQDRVVDAVIAGARVVAAPAVRRVA